MADMAQGGLHPAEVLFFQNSPPDLLYRKMGIKLDGRLLWNSPRLLRSNRIHILFTIQTLA